MLRILEKALIEGMLSYVLFPFVVEMDYIASVVRDVRESREYFRGTPDSFTLEESRVENDVV